MQGDSTSPLVTREAPGKVVTRTTEGQISNKAGRLERLIISPTVTAPTAGLLTIYDSLTETGTVLFSTFVRATDTPVSIHLGIPYATGLFAGFDASLANVRVTATIVD